MGNAQIPQEIIQASLTATNWIALISLAFVVISTVVAGFWKAMTVWRKMGVEMLDIKNRQFALEDKQKEHELLNDKEFDRIYELNNQLSNKIDKIPNRTMELLSNYDKLKK